MSITLNCGNVNGGNRSGYEVKPFEPELDKMKLECHWDEIHSFISLGEHKRFVKWIKNQVHQGNCEEIFDKDEARDQWRVRYFKCKSTDQLWKIACPDPGYFSGSWLPVENK
ncbi:hypothetical protein [Pseudovibrio ascidiaceicola]|uniref:hypothetical protein n=1 Tax=Pseudovibrio ascidiaceicola TaxID=285279 RepID=UPI000B885006|nr:hypothetical protein [Pseudovibrio ascidiaceicola]